MSHCQNLGKLGMIGVVVDVLRGICIHYTDSD